MPPRPLSHARSPKHGFWRLEATALGLSSVTMILALAEEAVHATDYDETLLPVAIGFLVGALVYAFVAAWIVTPSGDH